jgi:hypothetical protein
VSATGSTVDVGTFSGGATGGKPGPQTFAWDFPSPASPSVTRAFLNPLNASSQIVRFGPGMTANQDYTQPIRVTVTDSAGNTSQQTATAIATRIPLGGGGP